MHECAVSVAFNQYLAIRCFLKRVVLKHRCQSSFHDKQNTHAAIATLKRQVVQY